MTLKNRKILVTGGAGFIGGHLVDYLIKNGNRVLVIDNLSTGSLTNLPKSRNLKFVKADIRGKRKMEELFEGADLVFHLAVECVRKSLQNPFLVHEVNASGTLNVCQAALKNKVKKLVYVSSSEVYGTAEYVPMDEGHPLKPMTIYGASKLAGELNALAFFRTYHLPVVVVRPFNTYGPRSHFEGASGELIPRCVIKVLNDSPPIIFGDGKQERDFTFVSDTVNGLVKAARSEKMIGEAVNVAYGQGVSIKEIAEQILKILHKEKIGIRYESNRPGDVRQHFASTKKAAKMLNFKAKVDLEKGLRTYIRWVKKNLDFKKALKQIQDKNW